MAIGRRFVLMNASRAKKLKRATSAMQSAIKGSFRSRGFDANKNPDNNLADDDRWRRRRRRQRLWDDVWDGTAGQRADSSNNLITADQRPLAGNRSAKSRPPSSCLAIRPTLQAVDRTSAVAERAFHQRRQTSNLPTRRRQQKEPTTPYNNVFRCRPHCATKMKPKRKAIICKSSTCVSLDNVYGLLYKSYLYN